MPMRFGRFLSGKLFKQLFITLYIALMCFAAFETGTAFRLLTDLPYRFEIIYIVYGAAIVLLLTRNFVISKYNSRIYKKIMGFLGGFLIYYLLMFVSFELISFIFVLPDLVKSFGIITIIATSMATVFLGYLHTKSIAIKHYELEINSIKGNYRIALISDIHLGVFVGERHIYKIIQNINDLSPDIVVIAGDIFDVDNSLLEDSKRLYDISRQFSRLKTTEGVYAVLGNHDPKPDNPSLEAFLKASGIKLLNNDVKTLSKINLVGRADEANSQRINLTDLMSKADSNKPAVVLDHSPEGIGEAAKDNCDLILCGHTHRGQLFPVTLLAKWANGKERFYGCGIVGKTRYIITSGVGYFALPVRLGTSNEIVDIKIGSLPFSTKRV